jgi:hypothetical protein
MAVQLLYVTCESLAKVHAHLSPIHTHLSESHLVCVHQFSLAFPGGADANISFFSNVHVDDVDGRLDCRVGFLRKAKRCVVTTTFVM